MSTEDNKYDSLRSKLKGLPKIKAKDNFNDKLFARIREVERSASASEQYTVKKDRFTLAGWLEGLFRPAFIPALGLSVVLLAAVVVYFGYYSGKKDASTQQVSSSSPNQDKGEFVIYIHKDTDYPKNEIAALENTDNLRGGDQLSTTETKPSPVEMPSDFMAPKTEAPTYRMDKVSDEQKLEMQRSLDKEPVKSEDEKLDRRESKGELKSEKKAPSNYNREEKEDTINKSGDVNQEIDGSIINQQTESKKDNDDSVKSGKNRVAEKRKKDKSLAKTKSDSLKTQEQQQPDTNTQKEEDKK